jgi:dethiobiotin synthase
LLGIFVTGTDTGVGKTVVSSLVVASLRRFRRTAYWKPVQTGIEQDDDTAEVRRLANCADDEIVDAGIRLPRPLSPHLSARLAGRSIAIEDLSAIAGRLPKDRFWVVEGAGGILVPLNAKETMADLIAELGLPALVAARSGLGTINHTLLTLAELRRRSIRVSGVVMVGERNEENRKAIEEYGRTTVLAEIPVMADLSPDSVGELAQNLAADLGRVAR